MMAFVIAIHVTVCAILITVVLIQRGRGGGFIENLSGLESLMGPKTSVFLTKTTTVCAVIFFLTCLSLALLSVHKSKSLFDGYKASASAVKNTTEAVKPSPAPVQPPAEALPAAVEPAPIVPVANTTAVPAVTVVNTTRNAPAPRQGEW